MTTVTKWRSVSVLWAASLSLGCGKAAPSESALLESTRSGGSAQTAPSSAASVSAAATTAEVDAAAMPRALLPTSDCRQPAPSSKCAAGFCRVEPGCFVMGAPRDEFGVGRYTDRQVQVRISRAFELQQTEATRRQWRAVKWPFPKAKPQEPPSEPEPAAKVCTELDCPVANVSWFDALAFANRYSELQGLEPCYALADCTGEVGNGFVCSVVKVNAASPYACSGYRLPSEAEWEYAARAGTNSAFYSGDVKRQTDGGCHVDTSLESIGWYCRNSGNVAHPVARKSANGWGLYDTSGNVNEWCNDQKSVQGFGDGPFVDPLWSADAKTLSMGAQTSSRIARGGSYLSPACDSKASWRSAFPDATTGPNLGFRLARSLGPS